MLKPAVGGVSDNIKWYVLLFLLLVMCGIAIHIFFRQTNPTPEAKEGFESEPIYYDTQVDIPKAQQLASYLISVSDRDNGYYILRDQNQIPVKLVKLPYGYYKVDDTTMSRIPYGYSMAPQGTDPNVDYLKQIVPKTNAAKYEMSPGSIPGGKPVPIPQNGQIPDGFYKLNASNIALLPDGMKPNISKLDIIGTEQSPVLAETYDIGFVAEPAFYAKKFTITTKKDDDFGLLGKADRDFSSGITITSSSNLSTSTVPPLPSKIYYSVQNPPTGYPWTPNIVQYLPYGKIAKQDPITHILLPGYIDNPNLISKTGVFNYGTKSYKDISNNYDQTFHDSIEDIKAQNDMYDISFGSITVLDKDGNLVVLPRSQVQGDITYYAPGSYTFGATSYVPQYEDSVYLSRTTHMPTMADYRSSFKKSGFCEADKASPFIIEEKCNALETDACASTSCCVLLGGAKCVSGNETGPAMKNNYGDVLLRNKDSYTHLGKCYGNCP